MQVLNSDIAFCVVSRAPRIKWALRAAPNVVALPEEVGLLLVYQRHALCTLLVCCTAMLEPARCLLDVIGCLPEVCTCRTPAVPVPATATLDALGALSVCRHRPLLPRPPACQATAQRPRLVRLRPQVQANSLRRTKQLRHR